MKGGEFLSAYKGWVYACVNAIAVDVVTIDLRLDRLPAERHRQDQAAAHRR